MLQSADKEAEILLGNKQLLGIFFVAAALLGIAFTGGYMLGRGSGVKKATAALASTPATQTSASGAATTSAQGGETHSVAADDASQPAGPIRDAGELSSTRDALRKTGFRDVIVQRYD